MYIYIYYTYQLYPYLTCAYRHVYAYTLIAVSTYFAVYDADGDTFRCRLAVGSECGCVCNVFSIAVLQVGVVILSILLKHLIYRICHAMFKGLQLWHPINVKNIEIYIFCTFSLLHLCRKIAVLCTMAEEALVIMLLLFK